MSALIPRAPFDVTNKIVQTTTPFASVFGGCEHRASLSNWFSSTKAFKFSLALVGFTGDVGPWDFTDPDGDGTPGTNPANLHAYLASINLPDTDYWLRKVHADGNPFAPINVNYSQGGAGGLVFSFAGFRNVIEKADDNGKFYVRPDGGTSLQVSGGVTPDFWEIGFSTPGTGPACSFNWMDGSGDLQPTTFGAGAGGTITIVATDWWT